MKIKNSIFILLAVLSVGLNSCYDSKMEWGDPYTHPDAKDLPLALQEAISRYDALKAYTDLRLGVGMDFGLYTTTEAYRNIVNQNFTDITPGNELKQQSLMNSKGELDFTTADKLIDQMQKDGLTVYGHCLVWRSQQQAAYLNSLIAPMVIPGAPGSSLVDGSFEDGMGGWDAPYYKENFSIVNTDAIDGTQSLQVVIPNDFDGGNKFDGRGQLNSPDFPIINGHHYQISFWIKGSAPGQVAIDFPNANLGNQYPWINGAELASVGTSWTQVIYNNTTVGDAGMIATTDADAMHVRLLLAYVPDVTYLIDDIEITDLDASSTGADNLITDGSFEAGTIGSLPDGWISNNLSGGIEVSDEDARTGSQSVKMVSDASTTVNYKLQLVSPTLTVDPSKTYTFSFFVKSDVAGKGRISFPGQLNVGGTANEYPYLDWTGTGTATEAFNTTAGQWTWVSVDIQPQTTSLAFSFDMGYFADVTYYLDDVSLVEKSAPSPASKQPILRSGPITIPKTPEEKAAILQPILVNYITDVVTHFKGKVHAWDVVNEPMTDTGALDTGTEDLTQTSTFYWAYYLGKDYAVTAFKTAHAADPDAKLFINDYNIESKDGAKLQGLIDYVQYIESQGAKVDGIGTQMHLNINWTDSVGVENMFKKLGATGKLIKITELDICIDKGSGTSNPPASMVSPTADQYAQQANIYRYVVDMYKKYISADKQYGITIWSVTDGDTWRTNDAPCLWNADYTRKQAYKGFADGLAGKDVSADFSGDLVH